MQNHYELIISENGYTFKTDHGQIYELSFLLYPAVNDNDNFVLYIFGFEPTIKGRFPHDSKIETTIKHAINKFFGENNDALIVVLDSMDGRHHARKKLFDSWYCRHANSSIHKLDAHSVTEEIEIIASLLVEKSNPYYKEIVGSFFELAGINFYS